MRIVPGDPALLILAGTEGEGEYTEQQLHELRVSLGTDKPIYTQYAKWIWGVVRGDFGESFWYRGVPVMDEIKKRFPITFELGGALHTYLLYLVGAHRGDHRRQDRQVARPLG